MWSNISEYFEKYPAQEKVAQKMMEVGISVRNGSPYCGDIKITLSAMAEACGTDRRIVTSTMNTIESSKFLTGIFSNVLPVCSYKKVAPFMKWGVLEIVPEDVNRPGIISSVTGVLAKEGINIRQVIADDPDIASQPKTFIVTESQIPGKLLGKIKDLPGVGAVVIY